jgi:hypothetical protein
MPYNATLSVGLDFKCCNILSLEVIQYMFLLSLGIKDYIFFCSTYQTEPLVSYTGCLKKNGAVSKNLLNDYILQLDGAPPPIFTAMYESYSILFSNSAGSDVLQMETTTHTYYEYMGRIRLSCGCVSCDPGCTH